MVEFIKGNLWDSGADIILVTGNSYIKNDGSLVMGKGAAKQLAERYPDYPSIFGNMLKTYHREFSESSDLGKFGNIQMFGHLGCYGVMLIGNKDKFIGTFQTKRHFKDKSEIELIRWSFLRLSRLLDILNESYNKEFTVALNYPGIGYGGLSIEDVKPIIDEYAPDSLAIYSYSTIDEHTLHIGEG